MSLNSRQRTATRAELAANLELSGRSPADAARDLRMDAAQVQAALDVADAPPQDVWLVRDYLDCVTRSNGAVPLPYSSLSERMRESARRWFPLVDVEDVVNGVTR